MLPTIGNQLINQSVNATHFKGFSSKTLLLKRIE